MHEEDAGAFTGEVSAPMLVELDVEAVILGHSERRQLFGETDEALARKVPAALAAGLEPILCVGESEEARDAGQTEAVLERQLQADLADGRGRPTWPRVVVAYEPIWAIGTGRTATPEQAQEACAFIRDVLRERGGAADAVRILYGGSVKPANAAELLAQPDVDGALVGGASLDAEDFAAIVEARRVTALPVPSLALVILDGWGLAQPGPATRSPSPRRRSSTASGTRFPHTELSAQGRDVGLPDGQMGNSEVGHLNLGAGAIVKQDLARIDDAIADGSFFENEALLAACERARDSPRGRLHLLGLVSDGGVHSGWEHIEATIELAAQEGVPDVVFHAFTDGRDTLPHGGRGYLAELERWLRQAGQRRHRQRPLLRDGPRHPLGADQARLRRDRPRRGPARGERRRGDRGLLRARRDRRVRQADRDRRLRRRRRGRRRDLRQLPPRPRPAR